MDSDFFSRQKFMSADIKLRMRNKDKISENFQDGAHEP